MTPPPTGPAVLIGPEVLPAPQRPAAADWSAALDELLAVVEALCPRWPAPRPAAYDDMRL